MTDRITKLAMKWYTGEQESSSCNLCCAGAASLVAPGRRPQRRSKYSFLISIALQAATPLSRRNDPICYYQVGRWDRAVCQPTSAGQLIKEGYSS